MSELFNFDKTAAAIAALHSSDMKRSICHEQIVRALRDVKNAAWGQACDHDHRTSEEHAMIEAVMAWYNKQNEETWTAFIDALDTLHLLTFQAKERHDTQ